MKIYNFYYKRDNVMINIKQHHEKWINKDYYYELEFINNGRKYAINLKHTKEDEIGKFIDNLIFEEKY